MTGAARQRAILTEAVRFFAERGFEGQTRALAKRLGINHSLLYRHFAGKDDLIEQVYQEVYLGRWQPEWESLLRDRSRPLELRLKSFYRVYTDAIFELEWVRIFIFAGLRNVDINARYLTLIERHVLRPICGEVRAVAGMPSTDRMPISAEELEMAWGLHGKIFALAIRRWVYGVAVPKNVGATIDAAVEVFLRGALGWLAGAPGVGRRRDARPAPTHPGRTMPCRIPVESVGGDVPPTAVNGNVGDPVPGPPATKPAMRRRMQPEARERHIVDEAIKFFAEHGFEGQTRELARRMGITHPLLYRYFPTKDALIERVYTEVYLGRWNSAWDVLLRDETLPLDQRLVRFYREYSRATSTYEWMRIFMFAGLKGVNITRRYIALIRRHVIVPIAVASRRAAGLSLSERTAPSELELEAAWGLHEQIVYIMIRKWVYVLPVAGDIDRIIATLVTTFLEGAPVAAARLIRPDDRDSRQERYRAGVRIV